MNKKSILMFFLFVLQLCNLVCRSETKKNLNTESILDISQNGLYAITGQINELEDNMEFEYKISRIEILDSLTYTVVDTLPKNLLFVGFIDYPYLVYVTTYDNSNEKRMVVQNYLNLEQKIDLISCVKAGDCPEWFWYHSRFELNILDSLISYRTSTGIVLRKILPTGAMPIVQEFKDGIESRFSNDGNELLVTVNPGYNPLIVDTISHNFVVSFDVASKKTTVLFSTDFLGGTTPPSSFNQKSVVYFLSFENGGRVNNLWQFNRADFSFEQVTKLEYPLNVSSFYLAEKGIFCMINNILDKSESKSTVKVLPIK